MILLTGGSGFVGKALLAELGDDKVVTIGRTLAARNHVALDLAAASHEDVARAVTELEPLRPTILVHCAAVTPWSSGAPDFSLDLKMAQHVVKLCQKLSIERLVFVSGWNVYDMTAPAPYDEAKTPLNPTTDYGKSKLAVEQYLAKSLPNTKLISLRAASLYGPGQTTPGLIPNLVGATFRGEPLSLQAKTTRRDYVYIDDFVAAVTAAIELSTAEPHTIVNVGSGTTQSIEEVATAVQQICQKLYGKPVAISFAEELTEGQPSNNQLAIAKAQSLGLLPNSTPFSEGLERYIQWRKDEAIL